MRISKLLAMGAALGVCAWFVIAVRQTHALNEAIGITRRPHVTRSELARAGSLLSSAEALNPDLEVTLTRAVVDHLRHDPAAEQVALRVVRDEPHNVPAWYVVATVSGADQPTLFRALAEVNKLAPPPPPPR